LCTYSYRNFILDCRKEVYRRIEELLVDVKIMEDVAGAKFFKFFQPLGGENLYDFNMKVLKVINYSFWLSPNMSIPIKELNDLLMKYGVEANVRSLNSDDIKQQGVGPFEEFKSIFDSVHVIYFNDMMRLDDIRGFERKNSRYEVVIGFASRTYILVKPFGCNCLRAYAFSQAYRIE
jgi:hypothetical protein